ncbi:MAG: hypothetical protein IJD90_04145, partial [Clostridia bacterium]|nr:hypothetical protein [Clostridia bacterium]
EKPVATDVTGNTVTLQAVTNGLYSKDGGATWQTSNKFTGLNPGTTYNFCVKIKETISNLESAVSEITAVTTSAEYVFKASESSPKASGGTAKTDVWQSATDGTGTYNYVRHYDPVVGNKISFTIKGIQPGKYQLVVGSRNLSSRPTYSAVVTDTLGNSSSFGSLDFADVSTVDPKNPSATYHRLTTGTEIGQIYSNGTLTLTLTITSTPASPSTTHIDSFTFVKVGDIETDGEITSALTTQSTAAIRLGEVNGMRFYTAVDETELLELVGEKEYEIGTIIAPKDKVGEYLTMEDNVAKVVYDYAKFGLYDGKYVVGSIVNLKSSNSYNAQTGNLARDFIARAYVLVDGVYYYSESTCVRNIAQIADAYIADANSGYDTLEAEIKELVDLWAKAND